MVLASTQLFAEKIQFSTKSFLDNNWIVCELYGLWKGDSSFLCTKITTQEFVLDTPATVMFKTQKGDVFTLYGEQKGQNTNSTGSGIVINGSGTSSVSTSTGSMQLYPITQEQIELLKDGILKIRINTLPVFTEKTFKKDEIGTKLYKQFVEVKEKYDNF